MTVFLSVLITLAAGYHILWMTRANGLLTIDSVFTISTWTLTFGTLQILDLANDYDAVYCWVVTLPLLIYVFASQLTYLTLGRYTRRRRARRNIVYSSPGLLGYGILALSIAITLLYYSAVGYNVFLTGLRDTLSGSDVQDYTTLRVDSYSNQSGYLFPGYVNQFKNTLLPATSIAFIVYIYSHKKSGRLIAATIVSAITLIGVLGTGQRSMMIFLAYILIVFAYQIKPHRFYFRAFLILSTSIPLLLFSTFLLGRQQEKIDAADGFFEKTGILLYELFDRIFYVQQWSGQMVFHYTQTQPTQWGAEWAKALTGVLPGMSGTDLPRVVFEILFGTDRGTATPSVWGSAFYNFSWFGIVLLAIVLGVVFQRISFGFARKPTVTLLELVSYSGFAVTTGNWTVGGPEYLLNAGSITFAILWFLARRQASRRARQSHLAHPRSHVNEASTASVPESAEAS